MSARSSAPPSNFEGWAHYCEQMMLDEGLHADDPRYRLAQVHLALLRDVRFIVGIKMHTQGMTIEQAQDMFVKTPISRSRSRSPRRSAARPTPCTATTRWAS